MKIGWVSVSPFAKTGYGRMTREIVSRLLEKHEVTCIGHEADVTVWGSKKEIDFPQGKVNVLVMPNPMLNEKNAAEIVNHYTQKYGFEMLVGFWDAFALEFLKQVSTPYIAHIPIDGEFTRKWLGFVSKARRIVAYSQFGCREATKIVSPSRLEYVPHGVDTGTFRPLSSSKADLREAISQAANIPVPKDAFLLTCVAANVGERKNLPLLMRTFARFRRVHKEAHLYLHTNSSGGQGYDLPAIASDLGIRDAVHVPKYNPIMEPASDEDFCRLYNASDVFVSNSNGEGFMLPLLEAQSCGLPAVVPSNSAHVELVEGHGWVFDCVHPDVYLDYPAYVPTLQTYPVPDQQLLLSALQSAYSETEKLQRCGKESREFALGYDWNRIMPRWFRLFDELSEEAALTKDIQQSLKST